MLHYHPNKQPSALLTFQKLWTSQGSIKWPKMLTSVLALKMSELDFWNILPCLQSVITAYTDLLYYCFYRNYHLTEFFQLDDRKSGFFYPFFHLFYHMAYLIYFMMNGTFYSDLFSYSCYTTYMLRSSDYYLKEG